MRVVKIDTHEQGWARQAADRVVTAAGREFRSPSLGHPWLGRAGLVLLSLTAAIVLAVALRAPLKDDLAWLLRVARELLEGRQLYADIVEINPPLILWIMAVPAGLARSIGGSPELFAILISAAAVLACGGWTARLLRGYGDLFDHPAAVFAVLGIALLVLPGAELGQREHFIAGFALPYLVLCARRQCGCSPAMGQAILAGLLAGAAVGMKPYYLLAFAPVEILAVVAGVRLRRAEVIAAAAFLLAYGASLVVF